MATAQDSDDMQLQEAHQGEMMDNRTLPRTVIPASIQGETINIQHQNLVTGDNYHAQEMVINIGGKTKRKESPDFDLQSVRRQLMEEYKETRGKIPLVPGMPEKFAKMEDLFVNLEIIEEDQKPSGVICREMNSYGDIVCIERLKEKSEEKELVKRILVRGKPGAGKSTAMSKLAYDWACKKQDSPISRFELVFAIAINEIDTDTDLVGIIQDQLLPDVSGDGLRAYLQSNASSVAILFDGYDEASADFHQCKAVRHVLRSKSLTEACVIVTTRPNQVGTFCRNYGSYLQVEVKGFAENSRQKYVKKFMQNKERNSTDCALGFHDLLAKSTRLLQLSSIPIILSMLCLLWVESQTLPLSITALYTCVIMHLARHKYAKATTDDDMYDSTEELHDWVDKVLFHIGEIAIIGLLEDRLVFKANEFKKQHLEDALSLGVVVKQRQRSRTTVSNSVTFLHKTFQEICAALYWSKLVDRDMNTFKSYLCRITKRNVFQMEYVLRFACGLSNTAAEVILPHVVQIMCQHEWLRDNEGEIRSIDKNECQQLPLFLLHEAELNMKTNNQNQKLHALMKPLYSCVCIGEGKYSSQEFLEILDRYLDLQKETMAKRGQGKSWLDDVEKARIEVCQNDKQAAKMICSMPMLSALHVIENERFSRTDITSFLNILPKQQFTGSSLSELFFKEVFCDIQLFSQFLSSLPSLSNLTLANVFLRGTGTLINAITLPRLQELQIYGHSKLALCYAKEFFRLFSSLPSLTKLIISGVFIRGEWSGVISYPSLKQIELVASWWSDSVCTAIISEICRAGNLIENKIQCSRHQESIPSSEICLPFVKMRFTDLKSGETAKLLRAVKYMPHIKHISLKAGESDNRGEEECRELLESLQNTQKCNCMKGNDSNIELRASPYSSQLQELEFAGYDIGDFIDIFVRAYSYMPHLKCLKLHCALEPHQCEILFDGLIAAGKRDSRGSPLEVLTLRYSTLGYSVGTLARAFMYMPRLKSLDLDFQQFNPSQFATLLDGLIAVGKTMEHGLALESFKLFQQQIGDLVSKRTEAIMYMTRLRSLELHGLCPTQSAVLFDGLVKACKQSNDGLPYESLTCDCAIGDSVSKLAQAYIYMKRLKTLNISRLNPSQCAVLFDGFIVAGQRNESKMPLEVLDMSCNEIGDSVGKLAEAYMYMTGLKSLKLGRGYYTYVWKSYDGYRGLTPSQCAVLFDGFITAGQMLEQQSASRSDTQTDNQCPSPKELSIETLFLSCANNEIGQSVDKLCESLQYMPHLKLLNIRECKVTWDGKVLLKRFQKQLNAKFTLCDR
ncbi:uncharacterized protein [Amphiura filiformis]|uniref:uncharacterized protein isoform X2 n=1 Tax=Amphiura filiformis TaxID=82378 RepID=UPI003B227D94